MRSRAATKWPVSGRSGDYEVWYALRARNDIASIYRYIAERNPRAATAVVRKIRNTGRMLERHPRLGRPTQLENVRVIGTGRYPYLVYYAVDVAELTIIHVRDGRRDAPTPKDLGEPLLPD